MLTEERAFRESVLEGHSVREIAARHEVPKTNVHRLIKGGGKAFIEQLHLDLLKSHATGELPAFLLPDQPGPTFDRALDLMRWVTNELEQRGINVRVQYRTARNGLVIAFEDADPPANTKVRSLS